MACDREVSCSNPDRFTTNVHPLVTQAFYLSRRCNNAYKNLRCSVLKKILERSGIIIFKNTIL